jgi:hypothetical protein
MTINRERVGVCVGPATTPKQLSAIGALASGAQCIAQSTKKILGQVIPPHVGNGGTSAVPRRTAIPGTTRHLVSRQEEDMMTMKPALQRSLTSGALALMLVISNAFFAACVTGYRGPVVQTDWSRLASEPARIVVAAN